VAAAAVAQAQCWDEIAAEAAQGRCSKIARTAEAVAAAIHEMCWDVAMHPGLVEDTGH